MEPFKKCRLCGEMKPLGEFHRHSGRKDGHHTACKPCAIAEQQRSTMKPPRKVSPDGMKPCSHCKTIKPLADFQRNSSRYDGHTHWCRDCLRAHYRANTQSIADRTLRSRYGIPKGRYEKLLVAQDGKCAICGSDDPGRRGNEGLRRFAIDHIHDNGKRVRGLLCDTCNKGIGQLKDSPELLRKAADYLENPPAYQVT